MAAASGCIAGGGGAHPRQSSGRPGASRSREGKTQPGEGVGGWRQEAGKIEAGGKEWDEWPGMEGRIGTGIDGGVQQENKAKKPGWIPRRSWRYEEKETRTEKELAEVT